MEKLHKMKAGGVMTSAESYISHESAALTWDIPFLHVVLGYPSAELLKESLLKKEQRSYCSQGERTKFVLDETHYRVLPLPAGAVVRHGGETVASPELVFLDLARQLGFHQTVLLGMQLCASDSNGSKPLTTAAKLQDVLKGCPGHHGIKAAARAMRYVADNSWSVMESLLYMLLTLPHNYGGYGLKGAALNKEIRLKEKGAAQKANRFFADLYWEKAKFVVEYDSAEYHNNVNSWMKDARRITTLERSGYKTLSFNTAQLYHDDACTEMAEVIATYLGRRIQIRTPCYPEGKARLRGLLPRREALIA
jgi:very-short-patch-repair endonuclease